MRRRSGAANSDRKGFGNGSSVVARGEAHSAIRTRVRERDIWPGDAGHLALARPPDMREPDADTRQVDEGRRMTEPSYGRLRLYNLGMGALHALQGVAVLVLSNDFSLPVTAAFMEGPPGTPATTEELFTVPLGPAVAAFLFLSAVAHVVVAGPGWTKYRRDLAAHRNEQRWIEYAFSSSLMIVLIAMITGIADIAALVTLFGVAIVAAMTGAVVGFVIDFLLKEGQGMGAAGYRDHIVVCGWNTTARDLIEELKGDEFTTKVVLLADAERNPAGDGVYFVRGDITSTDDLERTGLREAHAVIVFPADRSNEADMRSILAVMAIESIAPGVRTVVEANNPAHVAHFRRANADEILVTSRLASRLLARSALYPGLSELVTDIVSGGEGSELYRVALPDSYVGLSIDELSSKLRGEHHATLLAVTRDGRSLTNPPTDFRLTPGDDAVVVAEDLGELRPLELQHE
jgi:voltage-gated potassium channel